MPGWVGRGIYLLHIIAAWVALVDVVEEVVMRRDFGVDVLGPA